MGCARIAASLLALSVFTAQAGCSDDGISGESNEAFTVENGDRFVVSATPEHIVLKKREGGITFPFNERSLKDKAILIHPVASRAEDGVYARALEIRAEKETYEIESRPLTLEEMATIAEDDIVRIYLDGARSRRKTEAEETVLVPSSWDWGAAGAVGPAAVSKNGQLFSGFSFGSGGDLGQAVFLKTGVKVTHTVVESSVRPRVLADWSEESGLELGFRGDIRWKSKLVVSGNVGNDFYKTKTLEAPPLVAFVPIGPVVVPVTLTGSASVGCGATASGSIDATVDIEANATMGGSLRVQIDRSKSPGEWVQQGQWPAEVRGQAGVKTSFGSKWNAAISCSVPRIQVSAKVAGAVGPHLALSAGTILDKDGSRLEVVFSGGASATFLGVTAAVDVPIYTWKQ